MKKVWNMPGIIKMEIVKVTKSGTNGNTEGATNNGSKKQPITPAS